MKIDDKYKWLARDKNGELYCFVNKPFKKENYWDWNTESRDDGGGLKGLQETDDTYSFIRWEQDEPVSVQFAKNAKEIIETQHNPVNKPSHYIGINGLEVEEVLENFLPKVSDGYVAHRLGSAVEYLLRSSTKNGLEDIKKAKRNLEQVIEYEEGKEQTIDKEVLANNFKMSCAVHSPFVSDNLMEFLSSLSHIPNEIKNYHAGTNPLD